MFSFFSVLMFLRLKFKRFLKIGDDVYKRSILALAVVACFAGELALAKGTGSSRKRHITEIVASNDKSLNDIKKTKVIKLQRHSDQLSTDDLIEIGSIFENYANSLNENNISTDELLEILSAGSINIRTDYKIKRSAHDKKRHYEGRKKTFESERLLRAKARKLLAQKGDAAIDILLKYNKTRPSSNNFPQEAIYTLSEIGSERAKRVLVDIIYGRIEGLRSSGASMALRSYLKIASVDEARQLLSLKDDELFHMTLRKFPELAIEPKAFDRLSNNLQSDEFVIRRKANSIINNSPANEKVFEKVHILTESLTTIPQMPKANERFLHQKIGTYSDYLYWDIAGTLMSLPDCDKQLADITYGLSGAARQWVIVVRARRSDASVKEELLSILQDHSNLERTMLRLSGFRALGVIGSPEDIPFLKEVSENDTYELLDRGGPLLERLDGKVINNAGERAETVYDEVMEIDLWANARIGYPIRGSARYAIKQIETKVNN